MPFSLPAVRISLYCALVSLPKSSQIYLTTKTFLLQAFFTFILFCLTAARLNYTSNLPPGDPLNGGRNFHGEESILLHYGPPKVLG